MEKPKRLCLLGSLGKDSSVIAACETWKHQIVFSENGLEYCDDQTYNTYYITNSFFGDDFEKLCQCKARILGSTALLQLAASAEPLPESDRPRPLYSFAMRGVTVCFTGFRKKEDLSNLLNLVRLMGGSVRRDMEYCTTHLIAKSIGGEKYEYASTFNIPIMSSSWIESAWASKDDVTFFATASENVSKHKLKFGGARVCFLGFSPEETSHMEQMLVSNNGTVSSIDDPLCTHLVLSCEETYHMVKSKILVFGGRQAREVQALPEPPSPSPMHGTLLDITVVDETSEPVIPEKRSPHCAIVKAEWFWTSVQNELCSDKREYQFENCEDDVLSPMSVKASTPSSASSRARKRKRLQQIYLTTSQNANGAESPLGNNKRRSSISDAGLLNISGSYLECTITPDKIADDKDTDKNKAISARQQVFLELLQTETNYVNILDTIVNLFKNPLDELVEKGNAILNPTEIKMIFGNLLPIQETHSSMMKDLRAMAANWHDSNSIGDIILKYAPEFEKAYPPFINYFEKSKEVLEQCDQNNARFHAFLKIRQSRVECGRQSLKELMIRPVQRLPSISLLLNDLWKHTSKENLDQASLEKALAAIREVMTHINEDKRRTEAQLAMFELFNEIENCPAHLISSHRSLVFKCECIEIADLKGCKKGDPVTFLLFNDTLEICCKRRAKGFPSFRGTKTRSFQKMNKVKQYKHIRLMPLSNIRRVFNVRETDDYQNVFGLLCRSSDSLKEVLCTFVLSEDNTDKKEFLKTLCQQLAHTVCTADPEAFLEEVEGADLMEQPSGNTLSYSISRALKFASRTGVKVGRALSMNKTPSQVNRSSMRPGQLQSMLSPNVSQMSQMRLQSCANLHELGCSTPKEIPTTPLSVQPTRRNLLSSTFSVSSLKLL